MTGGGAALHATAIVLGEAGILIRGKAGAGKSSLAAELVADWWAEGRFAALVGDDRVLLEASGGRLVARPHPAIAGTMELRGLGLVLVSFEAAAIVRLCVDLDETASRMADPAAAEIRIDGIAIPRITVNRALALSVTRWRVRCRDATLVVVK